MNRNKFFTKNGTNYMVKTFFSALKTLKIPLYSDMCFGYILVLTNIASNKYSIY